MKQAQPGPDTDKLEATGSFFKKISCISFCTQNILTINHEYWQHAIHFTPSPFQDYLTVAWGAKSNFWEVKIGTFIKIYLDQQSTHGGWFLHESVSFHWLAETFSHWAKLKQLFECIHLHLSEWHMHTRNLNPGIFFVSAVHFPCSKEGGNNIEKISHFVYFCKARSKIIKYFSVWVTAHIPVAIIGLHIFIKISDSCSYSSVRRWAEARFEFY